MNLDKKSLSLDGLKFGALIVNENDHILTLKLNRPERKNAINDMMANELIYCLTYADQNQNIRVVVIEAAGDIFCAGGDLRSMSGKEESEQSSVPKVGGGTEDISIRIRKLNKPVICKIQGRKTS